MNLPTWLVTTVYQMAKWYFNRAFFNRLEELILDLLDTDHPGEKKAQLVREAIKAEWAHVTTGTVNWALEIILAYVKQKHG